MKNTIYTLILMMTSGHLFAQTWDGSSNTNWNTAANWSTNTVPTSGSTVIIDAAVSNQPKLNASTTISELRISAGTLDLNGYTLTNTVRVEFTGGTVKNGSIVTTDIKKMANTTFNGPLTITQSGAGNDNTLDGGNFFNGAVTIINNLPKTLILGNQAADLYNGDITFVQQNVTGNLYPAYLNTNNFKGNISTLGSVKPVIFGNGGGSAVISGTIVQSMNGPAAQGPIFRTLVMNTTKGLVLNVPVSIGTTLTLTNGIIYSNATNLVILNDDATSTGASNGSHVSGPVRKIGNDAFTFPTGKGSLYAPISISAPSNATNHYTAEYFNIPTPHNMALLDILFLNHVSKEEYWALNRTSGLSNVIVTLSFNYAERSGTITNLPDLRIARWNTLLNLSSSHGNGGTTGNNSVGTLQTAGAVSSFGDFTIASATAQNPLQMVFAPLNMNWINPVQLSSTSWMFTNVRNGVDAIITVTGSKNATVDEIDNSSLYDNSWQPFIRYTNDMNNNSDSSYVQFKVDFVKNGVSEVQKSVAMTIVDIDGEGSVGGYRELLKVSQPSTPKGTANSLVTAATDVNWTTLIGTSLLFPTIDTTAYAAMSQVNMTNLSSYTMRVGVLGQIDGGKVRQASFAFNNFSAMNVVLPIRLLNLDAQYIGNDAKVNWTSAEEKNMKSFEVYRSVDGINYVQVGALMAKGNSQVANSYSVLDKLVSLEASENVFYKLRMIDYNDQYIWSHTIVLKKSGAAAVNVSAAYPNPTKGQLSLNIENSGSEFSIEVVDVYGKVIQSCVNTDLSFNSTISMDVKGLAAGVYFIRVTGTDGNSSLTRFIKN